MNEIKTAIIPVGKEATAIVKQFDDLELHGAIIAEIGQVKELWDENKDSFNFTFCVIGADDVRDRLHVKEIAEKIAKTTCENFTNDDGEPDYVHASIAILHYDSVTPPCKFSETGFNGFNCKEWFETSIPPDDNIENENSKIIDDCCESNNYCENLAHLKRKKIKRIRLHREWCKRNDRKPYTYVGSWIRAALESGDLSINELGVILVCKSFLSSPYALECWPGEKAVLKCMSSAKTTWLRNRDSLERKGWIIIEKFGSGTSPIIYVVIPGKKCPSKFAPKESSPDHDDTS